MTLWQAENEHLAVEIEEDAAASILDKETGTRWRMGRVALQEDNAIDMGHVWLRTQRSLCEQYPGRFRGTREGDRLRFELLGRAGRTAGVFSCRFQLDGPWLVCEIAEIDEALPSLVFPPPLQSESLVVPSGIGRWIRRPLTERYFWKYPAHLNMCWFGGLQGDSGWLAVLDRGAADAGVLAAEMSLSPGWLKSLGRWTGPRSVRYGFTRGGYVGLAKTFRAWAVARGLHRGLAEKIDAVPAAGPLQGGRLLSLMQADTQHPAHWEDRLQPVPPGVTEGLRPGITHAQAAEIIRDAQAQGMGRGLIVLRGWIKGGYDETHPDIWPPEPALGTTDELAALLAPDGPYTAALHDNYQDIYRQSPSWPRGVIRQPGGDPMPGGFWAGGQAYILNARDGLAYARRNWEQIRTLRPRALFVDTTTAVQFYESYETGNTLSRSEDAACKIELLQFCKAQGLVLGSEEGADFGMPWVDWLENRHHREAGTSVPLWPLVFHDAAFCARYASPLSPAGPGGAPQWLADMLWGYLLLWGLRRADEWPGLRAGFAGSGAVDDWHGRIGRDEMVSHRYLTEDGEVEETVFSSGAALTANFAADPRTVEGVTVPAGGYVLRD